MNKIMRFIKYYLIFGLPFVPLSYLSHIISPTLSSKIINMVPLTVLHILGFSLILWFPMVFIFLLLIVSIPSIREQTLRRLANLNERDEREHYITGQASRTAYISSLSVMLFLLFFSMFSLNLDKLPQKPHGPHYRLSFSLGYSVLNKKEVTKEQNGSALIDSKNIMPSTSTVLLILIAWQLMAFNLSARREQKLS